MKIKTCFLGKINIMNVSSAALAHRVVKVCRDFLLYFQAILDRANVRDMSQR